MKKEEERESLRKDQYEDQDTHDQKELGECRKKFGKYACWYHVLQKHVTSEGDRKKWLKNQKFDDASKAVIRKARKTFKGRDEEQAVQICEALKAFWAEALEEDGKWVKTEPDGIYKTNYARAFLSGDFWDFTKYEFRLYMTQLLEEQEISDWEYCRVASHVLNYYT